MEYLKFVSYSIFIYLLIPNVPQEVRNAGQFKKAIGLYKKKRSYLRVLIKYKYQIRLLILKIKSCYL